MNLPFTENQHVNAGASARVTISNTTTKKPARPQRDRLSPYSLLVIVGTTLIFLSLAKGISLIRNLSTILISFLFFFSYLQNKKFITSIMWNDTNNITCMCRNHKCISKYHLCIIMIDMASTSHQYSLFHKEVDG